MAEEFYNELGVTKKASADEIKKAYRKLAREYHPDRNPDDPAAEARFKKIQEAYATLSDPEKRKAYDSGGFFGFGGAGGQPGGGPGFGADIGDILSNIFGRGRGGADSVAGRDLETEVNLSFEQAMDGTQISVTVPKQARCSTCGGSGAAPGTTPRTCDRCNGRGIDAQSQGLFSISQPCPKCGGSGQLIDNPCSDCRGAGVTAQRKRYRVNIPPGVRDGTRIRLAGKGEDGPRGGPSGDLFVTTRVAASPVFDQRSDGSLEAIVPISYAEAVQGATIEVPILRGTKRIRIPAGTEHGSLQRLRGEGPPRPNRGGRSDIIYRLEIEVPKDLTNKQKKALDGFAKSMGGIDPREKLLRDARRRGRTEAAEQGPEDRSGAEGKVGAA